MDAFTDALLSFIVDFLNAVVWDNFVISLPLMFVVFSMLIIMIRRLWGMK